MALGGAFLSHSRLSLLARTSLAIGPCITEKRSVDAANFSWIAEDRSSPLGQAKVKTLIVFSGPCAAGKSTLARMEYASRTNTALLSRDSLRRRHPGYNDSDLTKALIQRAARILNKGRSCIVDACNLHEHDRIRWETVAIVCGAALEWRTVTTEMEICIARDAARADPVGDERIREQFALASR